MLDPCLRMTLDFYDQIFNNSIIVHPIERLYF